MKKNTIKGKIIKTFSMISLILMTMNTKAFATGIGTAEVQTATENIKRVITSIAMPLRRSINFC